jgi:hypothetical protein
MRVGRVESQVSLRFAWDAVAATTKRGWFHPPKNIFLWEKKQSWVAVWFGSRACINSTHLEIEERGCADS